MSGFVLFNLFFNTVLMVFSHLVFSSRPAEYDKNGGWEIHFSAHSGQISVPALSRVAQLFQRPDNSASGSQGYGGAFFPPMIKY